MNLSGWILKKTGWTFKVNLTMPDKCIIVIAPHTSNWDFILGELGIHSVGMKAGFLMKDTWFFFPLGYLMKALGGIPSTAVNTGTSPTRLPRPLSPRHALPSASPPRARAAPIPIGTRAPSSWLAMHRYQWC